MKIKLLLLLLIFCNISIVAKTKKTVTITPKSTFIGITKKGSTYTVQKLSDGMILGTKNGIIGRGYLEFDLVGKIPNGAEIDFAEIKLGSKMNEPVNNFGGKIRLEQAGAGINTAGASLWDMIKTIGLTNDYLGIEAEYYNPATTHYFTGEVITNAVKSFIGKQVAFKINHKNETGSKYVLLDAAEGGLSLIVHYYVEDSTTPPPPSEDRIVSRYGILEANADCDFYPTGNIVKTKNPWIYNSSYFETITNQDGYLLLRAKSDIRNLSGFVKTPISYKSTNKIYSTDIFIAGDITPKTLNNDNVANYGENVTFHVPGLEYLDGAVIRWTAVDNMTLVSGQGTNKAIFKTLNKNGAGKVKVQIAWESHGFTNVYSEVGSVWVGIPSISITSAMDANSVNSSYLDITNILTFGQFTTLVIDGFGLSYSASNADFEWQHNSGDFIFTTGNGVMSNPVDNGMGNIGKVATFKLKPGVYYGHLMFKIRAKNKYGWSNWKYLTWSGTPIYGGYGYSYADFKGISAPIINSIKSVKIYNITGSLVYSAENVSTDFDLRNTVLSDGIYIIEKSDGENKTTEKVILKR